MFKPSNLFLALALLSLAAICATFPAAQPAAAAKRAALPLATDG